jgi:hypothetical protein
MNRRSRHQHRSHRVLSSISSECIFWTNAALRSARQSVTGLLSPSTLGERRPRSLARRGIAVCWRPVLMMAEGQRPHPRRASRSCMDLEDAADNFTAHKHVEIVLVPVARRATCRCAFEDEAFERNRLATNSKLRDHGSSTPCAERRSLHI